MGSDTLNLRIQEYANLLTRYVITIFSKSSQGALESVGTGLLVHSSKNAFLISAAHVFNPIPEGQTLCFYAGVRALRAISGVIRLTPLLPGIKRDDDRLDIGVCKLEGKGLPPYPEVAKVALSVDALIPFAHPRENKHYLFTGFPASKSKVSRYSSCMESKPYAHVGQSATADDYSKLGLHPYTHIVLRFNHRKVQSQGGPFVQFPNPEGISGSPLWLLFDEVNENDPVQHPVVGIITEYHRDKCLLVATDIAKAIEFINTFEQI